MWQHAVLLCPHLAVGPRAVGDVIHLIQGLLQKQALVPLVQLGTDNAPNFVGESL